MSTTWKWVPVARYDIAATEKWLEKMAAKGLFYHADLNSKYFLNLFFLGNVAQFEMGQPKPGRRYRLDVNPDFYNGPTGQMRELYQQAGWEYAGYLCDRAFFVYYTDDPLAVEPYTDPHSQGDSLQSLGKITNYDVLFRSRARRFFFFPVLLICMPQFLQLTLKFYSPTQVLLAILSSVTLFLTFLCSLRSRGMAKRMRKHLEAGNSLKTFAPPKGQLALETAQSVMMAIVLLSQALYMPIVRRSATSHTTFHYFP